MPYNEITVIDKEVKVGLTPVEIYGFYTVPSTEQEIKEILKQKREGKIPKILRVRLWHRLEYVNPTPLASGSGSITFIDCDGHEVMPPPIYLNVDWQKPVSEHEFDITQHFTCPAPALGINAVKVSLGPAEIMVPLPETVYRIKVVMKISWGW